MKKILILLLLGFNILFAQKERNIKYIRYHAHIAVQEMEIYKVPASITLAQGILESAGGTSELANNANNHFGIKCKKEWTGRSYDKVSNEFYNGRKTAHSSCFRAYDKVEDSYRDHSKFLAERPYYKSCFKLEITDYKGWARCLKKSGYATDPKYAGLLSSIIETYNLNAFDTIKKEGIEPKIVQLYGEDPNKPQKTILEKPIEKVEEPIVEEIPIKVPPSKKIVIEKRERHPKERIKKHLNGNVEYIVLRSDDEITTLAKQYDIPTRKLLKYNDLKTIESLPEGKKFFLESKKSKGFQKLYKVKEGDTMYSIAQDNGIKLRSLYKRNRVKHGYQPKEGETIYLKGKRKK